MFTEITLFALISTLALFSFIGAGIIRFGLLRSYSSYSSKWGEAVPMNNMNLWSIVTFVAAFMLCPALLELGTASLWQFLGFLARLRHARPESHRLLLRVRHDNGLVQWLGKDMSRFLG